MREYMGLYRGKRVDNGEWVEGAFCPRNIRGIYPCIIKLTGAFAGYWFEVDPETVGECTGLKANGKLIFEGDILEREYLGAKHRYTVVYSRAAFAWGEKNKYGLTGKFGKGIGTIEIIGNIYDNPDLLEGAGDDATD